MPGLEESLLGLSVDEWYIQADISDAMLVTREDKSVMSLSNVSSNCETCGLSHCWLCLYTKGVKSPWSLILLPENF